MNRKDAADLDRHITGNYGEDSVDAQTQGYIDALKRIAAEYTFDLKHGSIGPKHDPYGCSTLTVTRKSDKKVAEHYEDGLGTRQINLYDAAGKAVDEIRWLDDTNMKRINWQAVRALAAFEKWVGISPGTARDVAEHQLSEQDEDPMGPASRYE